MSTQHRELQCRMCGLHGPLVKAHILPESLYPHRVSDATDVRIYARNPDVHPRRSPIGVYDKTILCAKCESLFSACDHYAHRVLTSRPVELPGPVLSLGNFDYPLLKRFFLSVLWRACVSSHEMFAQVDVGAPHEQRLRTMILTNDPGAPEEYAVCINVFDDPESEQLVFQPTPWKVRDATSYVNAYRFLVAGYVVFIKVSDRATPYPLNHAILRPDTDVPVLLRSWRNSRERDELIGFAARHVDRPR